MKKIIVIFIIVCCLLSFMEISCFAIESNKSPGEFWNKLSIETKVLFMTGFMAGIGECVVQILPIIIKKIEEKLLTNEEAKTVSELRKFYNYLDTNVPDVIRVMDDLYKDPANTHIKVCDIIKIAYQKLKGEDVEPLLHKARKEAFQNQ